MWIMEVYFVQSIDPLLFLVHMDKNNPIELLGNYSINYGDISFGLESAHDEDMNIMDRMENVVNIACFIHSVDIELLYRFFNLSWNSLNFKEGRQYSALL